MTLKEASIILRRFMGKRQSLAVGEILAGEEGEWMEAKLIELATMIWAMPKTYEQDGKGGAAIVYLHYFAGGSANWWITEKDATPVQHQAFGLANIFGGAEDGEMGYISIEEIIANGGELDFHFSPRTLDELRGRVPAVA